VPGSIGCQASVVAVLSYFEAFFAGFFAGAGFLAGAAGLAGFLAGSFAFAICILQFKYRQIKELYLLITCLNCR